MFNVDFGDSWSSKNSQSPLLRGGIGMDPLVGLFPNLGKWKVKTGDKLQEWVSDNVAKKNPIIKMDRKYGLANWSSDARKVSDWVQEKPIDSGVMVMGALAGAGALGGGAAAGGGAGLGTGGAAPSAGMTTAGFMPGSAASGAAGLEGVTVVGSSGAAMTPGTASALQAAGASAGAGAAQNNGFDWQKMLKNQAGGGGGGQQQQPQPQPMTWQQKMRAGLGRIGDNMLQIDSEAAKTMSPDQLAALKRNAFLNMGLGMMAASNQGAGFGEAAAYGLGKAQTDLTGALQRGYEHAREARQEQRQAERDQVADQRFQTEMDYRMAQDEIENERAEKAFERSITLDDRALSWREQDIARDDKQFDRQMRVRELDQQAEAARLGAGAAPSGYRRTAEGNLEPIPGGPADPSNKTGNYQEAERTAAFLGSRLAQAMETLKTIPAEDQKPGLIETAAKGLGSEMGANLLRSENRQKANAAQRDALDAALTLATGAAYTAEQIDAMRVSYFPQIGDSPETQRQKEQAFKTLLEAAKVKAGRAAEQIDKVIRPRGATGSWAVEEIP
jgi:hypothetical protein